MHFFSKMVDNICISVKNVVILQAEKNNFMKSFVVNHCTITPVRQEPSEGSEQLTQLLFGEVCEVLDRLPRWTKIRSTEDGQEGWVDFKMLSPTDTQYPISDTQYPISDTRTTDTRTTVAVPMAIATAMDTGEELMLTLGTHLPQYAHGTFEVLGKQYLIDPACVSMPISNSPSGRLIGGTPSDNHNVCAIAQTLLNAPYLWGGKNAMGMDCSGFTQVVYSVFDIHLLRNAREQITQGVLVPSLAEAQAGDLAFFDHADRDPNATNISHVGILLDNKKIIHCSGCVHVDDIDEMGIHLASGELTHHLVQIKRYP